MYVINVRKKKKLVTAIILHNLNTLTEVFLCI